MFFTKTRATNTDAGARARAAGQAAQAAAQNAKAAARAAAEAAQAAARNAAQNSQNVTQAAQGKAQQAQNIAQSVAQTAQDKAQSAGGTIQTTATEVGKGLQQGVYNARSWAAPRLESAADYTTTTVGPSVSSALRSTASQVRPAELVSPARQRMASTLKWSLLGTAILAGAGAVFALIRYQFRAATADEAVEVGETTDLAGKPAPAKSTGPATVAGQAAPAAQAGPAAPAAPKAQSAPSGQPAPGKPAASKTATDNTATDNTATTTDTSVNGHVTSSGW